MSDVRGATTLAVCAASWALCAASHANSDVRWDFRNDAKLIDAAKAELASGDLPQGRNVVELSYRYTADVQADHVDVTLEQIFFYPDAESVQNGGSDSIYWNTHGQTLTVEAAAVITPDGAVRRFEPASAQVLTDSSTSVFTTRNELVLQLPGLEPGALSVLRYTIRRDDTRNFMMGGYAQAGLKTRGREFAVTWQDEKPVWHADDNAFECQETANSVTCVSRLTEPAQTDYSVYYADEIPRFTAASSNTWDDVITQILGFMQDSMRDRSMLTRIVEELKGAEDPLPDLLDLVAKNIRYVSFSEAEYAYRPHAIGQTLRNRYGDCKGKSAVLLALLQELGYDAYPVLVATGMQRPSSVVLPNRAHFDHMVVCAQLPDGERCFDPTDVHAGAGATPRGIQGKVRLNLVPGSVPSVIERDEFVWEFHAQSDLVFQPDGSQAETLERTYRTAYAASVRGQLATREAEEQTDFLREQHELVVGELSDASFDVQRLDQAHDPLSIVSRGRYLNLTEPGEALSYVDGAHWLKDEIGQHRIDNEHYGIEIEGAFYSSVYRFDLQGLWALTGLGPRVQFNSKFGSFTREYVHKSGQVEVKTQIRIPSQRVEVEAIDNYNRFLDIASAETRMQFWGEPAQADGRLRKLNLKNQ